MDKTEAIAKLAREPEDKMLLARVWDKFSQFERQNIPTATDFLSPREQALAQALLRGAGTEGVLDGGYDGAERRRLVFLPGWAEGDGGQLVFLRASFRGPEGLGHRDILGSLMGLGVVRGKIGDILVSPHSADIIAAPSLKEFFLREWHGAGRVKLDVSEISREQLLLPEVEVKVLRDTVSSLRLDAVAAAAFSTSRGKAVEFIRAGRVSLDHLPCDKPDKAVGEGAVLTVRGLGRAKLREVGPATKKGRTVVVIERYF